MTSTASRGPMPQIPITPTNPNTTSSTTTSSTNVNTLSPLTNWKSLNQTAYGSRHIHDPAPFTLWNPRAKSFRDPTDRELSWLFSVYNAKRLDLSYPVITIVTDTIPDPVPLTIACVAVRLVRSAEVGLFREGVVETNACDYADEGLPDHVGFRLRMWKSPTEAQVERIVRALGDAGANVKAVTWAGPWCFVELVTGDRRVYGKGFLPGIIAGRTVAYHHSERGLFEDVRDEASLRDLKDSNQTTRENPGLHLGGVLGNSFTRLVRSNEVADGAWCSANSLSTGKVYFQCIGIRAVVRASSSQSQTETKTPGVNYEIERVFSVFNPSQGRKIQNLRGVPMVEESSLLERYKGGGVFGFFRDGDYDMAFCTVLDDIVDAGWELC